MSAYHGAQDAAYLDESIVSPRQVRARDTELHASAGEVVRQKDIEQRVCETDDGPRQPEEDGCEGDLFGDEEGAEVDEEFAHGEAAAGVGGVDDAAGLEFLDGEGTRSFVSICELFEDVDYLGVFALSQEELGGFAEADHGHAEDAEDEDEGTHSVHEIAPSAVVGLCAVACICTGKVGYRSSQ